MWDRYRIQEARWRRLLILTHHKVAAEVILSPLIVPLAHGLHPLDKLSQDAGLVHFFNLLVAFSFKKISQTGRGVGEMLQNNKTKADTGKEGRRKGGE